MSMVRALTLLRTSLMHLNACLDVSAACEESDRGGMYPQHKSKSASPALASGQQLFPQTKAAARKAH
eukprot:12293710-Alexandrium_andersonii.AAC.1